MKCLFVYNKISGGSKEVSYHEEIIKYLNNIYDYVDLFEPNVGKDISTVLSCNNYDDVICAGGDGSITLLIDKLKQLDFNGNIGYIPLGTANDFARKNNLPLNIDKSLKVIKDRNIENIKIGKANNKVLLYGLALGKISSVSYTAKIHNKKRFAKFSYIIEGLKELFSFKTKKIYLKFQGYEIEYDTPLILILDSKTLGGFKVNHGKLNSYDVLILKKGLLNGLFGIASIFLFGYKKTNTIYYDYFSLQDFCVETSKIESWCLDGERYDSESIEIHARKENINLYTKKVG